MRSGIEMVKMSGAGNDFIVIAREQRDRLDEHFVDWVRRVCRRGLAVGADGVLVVGSVGTDRVAVEFLNPDGSRAFCGNGSRCAARFAFATGLAGSRMTLVTEGGELEATVDGGRVRLALPLPVDLGPRPFVAEDGTLTGRFVRAGVPHFVVLDGPFEGDALSLWGPRIRRDPGFGSEGTNLDLVRIRDETTLLLRTWERGVEGETLSCGSGAVAAAFAARLSGAPPLQTVIPASGIALSVELPGPPDRPEGAFLVGDARFVLSGSVDAEATEGF